MKAVVTGGTGMLGKKLGPQTLKHIPIIIVSALNDIGSKKDAFNAGAKDFITKPFLPKELAQKINALT